jgi:uncharacterized membrane protein
MNTKKCSLSCFYDLISISLLIFLSLKFTSLIPEFIDIVGADESGYLYYGIKGTLGLSQGPLYGLWYKFLANFTDNNVDLYFLSYRLTALIPCLMLYVLLRSHKTTPTISFLTCWLFSMSAANIYLWPRIGLFTLALILLLLSISNIFKENRLYFLFLTLGSLIISYARPEYILTTAICLLISIFITLRTKKGRFETVVITMLLTLLAFASLLPVQDNLNRSWFAFSQHFSLRYVENTKSDLNPWLDYQQIMEEQFGNSSSIKEALFTNPKAALSHFYQNLTNIHRNIPEPYQAITAVTHHDAYFSYQQVRYVLILALIIFFLNKAIRQPFAINRHHIAIIAFMLPALISSIIFYPRNHYTFTLSILLSLIFLCANNNDQNKPVINKNKLKLFLLPCIWILAITLTAPATYQSLYGMNTTPPKIETQKTIRFINSLSFTQEPIILDHELAYVVYVKPPVSTYSSRTKQAGFYRFLEETKINMIVLSPALAEDLLYKSDPEWLEFIENPKIKGFITIHIPDTDRRLLLKDGIIAAK